MMRMCNNCFAATSDDEQTRCAACEKPLATKQTQVGGNHYLGDTQPIDLIRCMTPSGNMLVDYAKANAIKYAFRIKGGKEKMIEDLRKAIHYCQIAIEELEK